MRHVAGLFVLLVSALFLSLLETQIEGAHGWAAQLPTWRIQRRWTDRLLGGRPLTGYHLYLHLFVLAIMHAPYGLGLMKFSLGAELRILGFLMVFWVIEDFLYFVVNPAFGLRRFRPEHIWWHAHWWWFMPREYWVFLPLGVALYACSYSAT